MGAPRLASSPQALTAEQAEALSQRHIKKHHVAIMLLHWFNATVWLVEIATGIVLISSPYFRVAPQWYVNLVQGLFQSRADMLHFHIVIGITWIVVFVIYGTFGWQTYLHKEVLQREIALDRDDINWLRIRTFNILKRTNDPLPPQGIYNAGQKLFAFLVYATIPIVMITGLIMAFHLFSTTIVAWAIIIHFFAVAMVVSGLMIHVYMGAVFPEEKPAFFSMITGTVNELYAYRHHFKWWKEVAMRRDQYFHAMQDSGSGGGTAPKPVPESVPLTVPQVREANLGISPAATEETARKHGLLWRILRQPDYWPPYVAGFGLGLTLLATYLVMGEGLGASSGFNRFVLQLLLWIAPGYVAHSPQWNTYVQPGQSPLFDFIVLELVGVAIGGFVSGWLSGRLRITVEKGPRISTGTRYMLATLGGILTGIGARMARGCTSGLALSGGAVLSVGAFLFMFSVFAAGFIGAYFMRRYWL
jgi:formate dehydrogenase gamma subunit